MARKYAVTKVNSLEADATGNVELTGLGYIPITGTEVENPVTGDIETLGGVNIKTLSEDGSNYNYVAFNNNSLVFETRNSNLAPATNRSSITIAPEGVQVNSVGDSPYGLKGSADFSQNAKLDLNAYVQYSYLKPQIDVTSDATFTITPTNGVNMITFTGTTTTATLPPIAGFEGLILFLTNAGLGLITINSNAGGNDIWEGGVDVNTTTAVAGSVMRLINDGLKYRVL